MGNSPKQPPYPADAKAAGAGIPKKSIATNSAVVSPISAAAGADAPHSSSPSSSTIGVPETSVERTGELAGS